MPANADALMLMTRWIDIQRERQRPDLEDDALEALMDAEDEIEAAILALPAGAPNAAAARGMVLADRAALAMDSLAEDDTLLKNVISAFAGGVLA